MNANFDYKICNKIIIIYYNNYTYNSNAKKLTLQL